jgi:tetratricopeptide (TPR) repeat protein
MSWSPEKTAKESSAPANDMPVGQALALAQGHWNAGQADLAEMYCQRVLAQWPGQADALHLLGLMAHAYGNLDVAITHLRQACLAPRAPAVYSANLAEMCRQRGLLAEGEIHGRRAVTMDTTHAGGWNNLGIILQEAGQYEESKRCLERVLTLQPHNADAYNNLGNTCKRLGQLADAEKHWNRALSLRPNYAEPHSNLSNLLSSQGEYDRAAEHARRAIELSPRFADAYINLAGVETARARHQEALRWLDALLSFAPNHAVGLAAKALTLKKLDRLAEALEVSDKAIAAAPENAEAHNAHGQILQALGRSDAALVAYEKAATLPGTAAEQAIINRAILYMEQGESAKAEAAFQQATDLFPGSAAAWFNGADLRKFTPEDPAISAMDALLNDNQNTSANDKMLLHFALGKAYLDIGDSKLAFAHLDTGNRMKRASVVYDPVSTGAWMKQVAEVFSPALLERMGGHGARSNQPVFVLGMPRSGTSLVEQVLASHAQVQGAGELSFMQGIVNSLGDFPRAVANLTPEILQQLGAGYLRDIAPLAGGKPFMVDKMPINFVYAGLIRLILPDAHIIHCRRDPVDTCLSCYSKLFTAEQAFSYDQTELGQFHLMYQELTAYWGRVLPASHFIDLDYEMMVDDLEGQARRMLDFLGLPWDPAVLNFHQTQRTVRTASVNQVRQPVYKSSAGRWKKHAEQLGPLLAALNISGG